MQGGSISPLLANIYLHYAFDLWVKQWRGRHARGDVIVVRYADDWVAGFQFRDDAERFQRAVAERLGQFGLKLHPDKTRLIEFGRFARDNRRRTRTRQTADLRLPGVHALLRQDTEGQVHGPAADQCQTPASQAAGGQARTADGACTDPIAEQGQYLRAVVAGHGRYFGVPCNGARLRSFRHQVGRLWHRTLCRRSQSQAPDLATHVSIDRALVACPAHLPPVPEPASDRHDPRQEPYAVAPHVRICGGGAG